MDRDLALCAGAAGALAFGAAGLSVALLGIGVPFLVGALLSGLAAAVLLYTLGRWSRGRRNEVDAAALAHRIRALEESNAGLRHDLRGVLSPPLMMADRLLRNDDPAIRRAGQAVVRSVERATALLAENKRHNDHPAAEAAPVAAAPPPPPRSDGTDAPAA